MLTLENGEMAAKAKENEADISKTYPGGRTYNEYVNLARDSSHSNQVLPQGRKERMIGLELEKQGKIGKIMSDAWSVTKSTNRKIKEKIKMQVNGANVKQIKRGVYYTLSSSTVNVGRYRYTIPVNSVVIPEENLIYVKTRKGCFAWKYISDNLLCCYSMFNFAATS